MSKSRDFTRLHEPFFPGLVIHHDPRNERYLYTDTQPKLVARGEKKAELPLKPKAHRQWRRYDQGAAPSCTGFSGVTYCAAANEFNPPPIDGAAWYARVQANDRAEGLNFPEGGTVTSSMKTGKDLKLWDVYRWIFDVPNMERAIQTRPLLGGTNWYPSMFERDAEGIVRTPSKTERPVGGHMYHIGAWNKARGLWRIDNTWAPSSSEKALPFGGWCYFVPSELMFRLVREEGEIAVPDEVRLVA